MAIIVQKFGGTSVADLERISCVADLVIEEIKKGNKVVVVASAMAKVTNQLSDLVKNNFSVEDQESLYEFDSILSTGEQVSTALLALTLRKKGYKARSVLGWQIPMITNYEFGKSRVKTIKKDIICNLIDENQIPIIAGFQAVDASNRITTLGRGGSDTSAVLIAAALQAKRCDIYTDVDGVFTCDPRIVKDAKKLDHISYEEILELASLGAKVLQTRSVEIGMMYNIPLKVLSSFENQKGTLVTQEDKKMEKRLITAITHTKDESSISVRGVPITEGAIAILDKCSDVNVDTIVQNLNYENSEIDITFTLPRNDCKKVVSRIKEDQTNINYKSLVSEENLAKVSVVGVGMKSHSGVARDMLKVLADKKINVKVISTSEIKISVIISEEYVELAVRALHSTFELDK